MLFSIFRFAILILLLIKFLESNTALFLYLEPIVAIVGAVILLKETLNNYQIMGAIIVLSSLTLATYLNKKSKNDFS